MVSAVTEGDGEERANENGEGGPNGNGAPTEQRGSGVPTEQLELLAMMQQLGWRGSDLYRRWKLGTLRDVGVVLGNPGHVARQWYSD